MNKDNIIKDQNVLYCNNKSKRAKKKNVNNSIKIRDRKMRHVANEGEEADLQKDARGDPRTSVLVEIFDVEVIKGSE